MLVLHDVDEPTENVMATENQVVAYWEKDCLGQGNLFLTDRQLIWINPNSHKGLRLPIPSIVVHAVSSSGEDFPEPCLFTLVDIGKAGVEYTPEQSDVDDDDEEDEVRTAAFRLIPSNPSKISELFTTMNKCQELNPEPDEDISEDDELDEYAECGQNGEGNEDEDEEMAEH